jgi:N-acetylglucosaminyldiphosphoundecaprenol N-acetyl-beta-D-mannosaminyltransferase
MDRQTPDRIDVLGVPVDCVDMDMAMGHVARVLEGDRAQAVIAVNPEKVIAAQSNPRLLQALDGAGLLIPDGIGMVLAARLLHGRILRRVPGSELMPKICDYAARMRYPVFLFGASAEVNDLASKELRRRYQGIDIAGAKHGYVRDEDMPALVERINASGAKILFVALGSPRQEDWMLKYLPSLKVRVCQGVGGTFDVLAGRVRRAPPVFLKLNLEWLYRLLANPKRLTRQTALPRFLFQTVKSSLAASAQDRNS